MVRTVKNHQHHQEEEDDEDLISRTTDGFSQKDVRSNDQKASSHRSKHSETEHRRRSKINERFQILRDIIPQNDQKRDRASFLLEVYEGTYQGWSPEPTKLMPWRGNCGAENLADQSHPVKNGSVDEGNIVHTSTQYTNAHNLVEPDLSDKTVFKTTDHGTARAVSMDASLRQNIFESELSHTSQGSFPNVEILTSRSRPQTWNAIQSCTPSDLEESSISNAYSRGLLNNLTQALGSSGVDLSQANISVQFDIRKRTSIGATSKSLGIKDHDLLSSEDQETTHFDGDDVSDQAYKRPRT